MYRRVHLAEAVVVVVQVQPCGHTAEQEQPGRDMPVAATTTCAHLLILPVVVAAQGRLAVTPH